MDVRHHHLRLQGMLTSTLPPSTDINILNCSIRQRTTRDPIWFQGRQHLVSHRVNFVVLRWVARALPSVWMPLTPRDATGHEMKVVHQRKRAPVYLDELAARGRLAGGLQSSMVIEEVGLSGVILVDCPNLDFFFSLPAVVNLFFRSAPRFAGMFKCWLLWHSSPDPCNRHYHCFRCIKSIHRPSSNGSLSNIHATDFCVL